MAPSMSASTVRAFSLSSTTRRRLPRRSGLGTSARRALPRPMRAVNQKVEPWPGTLSTPTSPPMSSASLREMASPSPVPPYLRVVEVSACWKLWNRRPRCSSVRPMPVSRTSKRSRTVSPRSSSSFTTMSISPWSVNFTALLA